MMKEKEVQELVSFNDSDISIVDLDERLEFLSLGGVVANGFSCGDFGCGIHTCGSFTAYTP